jgi:hypothetical protein
MTEGLEVYKHMLRAFTRSDSEELLNGIDSRELLKRIETADADANIRQSDLTQALDRVDRLQVKPVFGRSSSRTTVTVAGCSLLTGRSSSIGNTAVQHGRGRRMLRWLPPSEQRRTANN